MTGMPTASRAGRSPLATIMRRTRSAAAGGCSSLVGGAATSAPAWTASSSRPSPSRAPTPSRAQRRNWSSPHAGKCLGGQLVQQQLAPAQVVGRHFRADLGGVDAIDARRIAAEYLRPDLGRELLVAELLAHPVRDLDRPEGVDQRLRRAVPDAVAAPDDVVLAEMLDQLADHMGGLDRPADDGEPGRAELGEDIVPGANTGLEAGVDQTVDPLARGLLRIGSLGGRIFQREFVA